MIAKIKAIVVLNRLVGMYVFAVLCVLCTVSCSKDMWNDSNFYAHPLQEKETLRDLAISYTGEAENWRVIDYVNKEKNNSIRVGEVVWIPNRLIVSRPEPTVVETPSAQGTKSKQETVKKEAVKKETVKQEAVKPEAVKQPEVVKQEAVKQEIVRTPPPVTVPVESTPTGTAIHVQESDSEIREKLLRSLLAD